jgi:hypothetical protein
VYAQYLERKAAEPGFIVDLKEVDVEYAGKTQSIFRHMRDIWTQHIEPALMADPDDPHYHIIKTSMDAHKAARTETWVSLPDDH